MSFALVALWLCGVACIVLAFRIGVNTERNRAEDAALRGVVREQRKYSAEYVGEKLANREGVVWH